MTATREHQNGGFGPPTPPSLPVTIKSNLEHTFPSFIDSTIDDMRASGLSWQYRYPPGASHDTLKRFAAPDLALKLSFKASLLRGHLPSKVAMQTTTPFKPDELLDGFQSYNSLLVQGQYASAIWREYIPPYIEASRGKQIESTFLAIIRDRVRQIKSPFGTEGKKVTFDKEIYPTILTVHAIAHRRRRDINLLPKPRKGQ